MPYASDKLYNGYLRRNMAKFVTKVKVREIVPHLACLTVSDRDEIEAKTSSHGNYSGMQHLLDCLKRRENWPDELIEALESCEQRTLAEEVRLEYNSLRVQSNPKPPSPATTVIKAHVHPVPSTNPSLPIPESTDETPAVMVPQAGPPPESNPSVPSPPEVTAQPVAPPSPAPQAPSAVSSPEPAPQAPQASVAPEIAPQEAPPATAPQEAPPATAPQEAPPATAPQEAPPVTAPQEAPPATAPQEAPPATAPQDDSINKNPIPNLNNTCALDGQVSSVNSESASELEPPVLESERSSSPQPDSIKTVLLEVNPSQDVAPTQTTPSLAESVASTQITPPLNESAAPAETPPPSDSTPTVAASSSVQTPEKRPVQDTTPPADIRVIPVLQQPEEHSDPTVTQVSENDQHTEPAQGNSSQHTSEATATTLPAVDSTDGAVSYFNDGEDEYFSKPGILFSEQQNTGSPTMLSPICEEPYSGDTNRLEISESVSGCEPTSPVPIIMANPVVAAEPMPAPSPLPCQENGVLEEPYPLSHNEPEEDHYESTCQSSLVDQEVLVNVVHVSGEPSIQNHDGQSPSMLINVVSASENPPVENHDSQSQIVLGDAVSVSAESSGQNHDVPTEIVLGNAVSMSEESQGQILNGQATSSSSKPPDYAPPTSAVTLSIVNAPPNENIHHPEPMGVEVIPELKPLGQQELREEGAPLTHNPQNYYVLTAAAVGISALFVAWRFRN